MKMNTILMEIITVKNDEVQYIVNQEENLNEQKISIEESEENSIAKENEEENIFIHISSLSMKIFFT